MYKLVSLNFKITITFFFFFIKVYYSVKSKQHRNNLLADQIIDCAIFFETLVIKGKLIVKVTLKTKVHTFSDRFA